ncbi:MAG: hypothetical protein KGQ62_01570, partial [Gammaproteobacteria bacterium]|nr:hypothetical protein [Gammaproteobacteria bacterium]MDE1983253.1 hypothetical protein [Gammaproteobacteria bacterium]
MKTEKPRAMWACRMRQAGSHWLPWSAAQPVNPLRSPFRRVRRVVIPAKLVLAKAPCRHSRDSGNPVLIKKPPPAATIFESGF